MTGVETIRVTRHPGDGIAEITLNRPGAMNAISTAMAGELARACAEIAAAPEVRVVVLSAAGERAFCVGADLKERAGMTDADILRQRHAMRGVFGAVLALPQPAVAAVHGFALGGGCELALSCDLVVADETAAFGLPEVTVGLVPGGGGTQLTLRRLGYGRAADLVLTGRRVGIDEAQRLGLVDRRVPAGRDGAAALELAGQIAARGRRLADRRAVGRPAGGHRRLRREAQAGLAGAVTRPVRLTSRAARWRTGPVPGRRRRWRSRRSTVPSSSP